MMHIIENAYLRVSVEEKGAELQSVLASDGTECLWQGDPKYWGDRALVIFPYVARLTEGKYQMDGQTYEMPIHGFAPTSVFTCVEKDDSRLVLELTDSEQTRRSYPRSFVFRVIYTLKEQTLETVYEVENRSQQTMYFGLGGHPGFNVPLAEGLSFEDYVLRFTDPCKPSRIGFTEACFLDGTDSPFPLQGDVTLPLRHDLFDEDAIVLKNTSREVTLCTDKDPRRITVAFPQMPYLGIWHWPKTDAPYVCIEPWCSLPATQDKLTIMEEQKDLLCLEPGHIYRNLWTIKVSCL